MYHFIQRTDFYKIYFSLIKFSDILRKYLIDIYLKYDHFKSNLKQFFPQILKTVSEIRNKSQINK